jgi:tRNA(Ile)-lysidine synthase
MTTWSTLHAHLHQTLRSRPAQVSPLTTAPLLPPGSRILVAISGGQDSQCLLRLLVDLQAKWQWSLHSIHCNHQWRTDADENARFVAHCSEHWHVPCTLKRATTPPASEAAARHWRYRLFEQVARAAACTHVVTGHTASDRAETLLYNLIRGSGTDGLQALTWQRPLSATATDIAVVRPLLDVTRAQTGQFCRDLGIPVWEDTTNAERSYARNRLRLDVLPLLREQFNPQVDSTLAQTAEILAADVEFLEAETASLLKHVVVDGGIQRRSLQSAPLALQRRVVRQVLIHGLGVTPRFEHIEKVVALLRAPNRSQTDPLPGGTIAIVDDPWIRFQSPSPSPSAISSPPQPPGP